MAVGLAPLPEFHGIDGVRIGVASAGIKRPGKRDIVLFELAEGARTAGVFTKNAFCAAPVVLAKANLAAASPRYLLINTGNANAGTGEAGMRNAQACCAWVAEQGGVAPDQVLPFSTGVIGEPLPVDKIQAAIPAAFANLSDNAWDAAAQGIMTTDTLPKGASVRLEIGGHPVHISGVSKGAGMIRPNMATMLGYVATDATIDQSLLQRLVREMADASFNRITIDGDTSTNDSCLLIATGKSGAPAFTEENEVLWAPFKQALRQLFMTLAQAIVRDGEGATKFVTVQVNGAGTQDEALDVAYTIAHTPLVKTALFASDPNWGRILAAIGRAGIADLDVTKIDVFLNQTCIAQQGGRAPTYTEEQGQAEMSKEEICIRVELNRGAVSEVIWTTDLSHEYVRINAEYRT